MKRLLISGVAALVCASMACAQKGPDPGTMTGNGGPQGATDVGKYANYDQLANKQTGSMHFYGKVTMASGRLPWDPIPVVVTCDGKTRYNTVTDAKGSFDIVPEARNSEVTSQIKDPQHAAPAQLIGCSVNAMLQGFSSTTLTIANRNLEDDPSIGTITLTQDEHAKGSILSATTNSASADALKEFEKARSDVLAKHADSARKHLQKAVSLDPSFAEAWFHLGQLEEKDNPQQALAAYQKAVAADASYIPPYEGVAAMSAADKKWQAVVDATNQDLKLDPTGTPQVWYFNAVGYYNLRNSSQAETSAETALAMDPSHLAPNTEQLLAVILAGRGDYAAALDHLRHSLTYLPPGPNADLIKQQIAQLEKVVPQQAK